MSLDNAPPIDPAAPRRRSADRGLRILAVLAALLVVGAACFWLFVIDGRLPTEGPSMRPTLQGRAMLEFDFRAYRDTAPARGDIVALQAPRGWRAGRCGIPRRAGSPCGRPLPGYGAQRLVKRVVAGPGQTVAFTARGRLILDGEAAREPYIRPCPAGCALQDAIEVPAGHYFVAGDNRPMSVDSRDFGPMPREALDGRLVD